MSKEIEGVVELMPGGSGLLHVENEKYKISPENLKRSLNEDSVIAELYDRKGEVYAKVKKTIKRNKIKFTGTISMYKKTGTAFFTPDDKKTSFDFFIDKKYLQGAKNRDKVVVKFSRWRKGFKKPNGIVTKILGRAGKHETEISSIIAQNDIKNAFSKAVMREVDRIPDVITDEEITKRRDFRNITTFTIDGHSSKDFDDALSVKKMSGDVFEIGVHIADVCYYVKPGSKTYEEAFKRGTSVYLVDRCIPMLPEKLSNDLCSLKPEVDRLTFSFIFKINKQGEILEEWFGRGVINSNKRFTYDEVQGVIEKYRECRDENSRIYSELEYEIWQLNKLAKKIRKKRVEAGAFSFSKKESEFIFDSDGKISTIITRKSEDSHQLIEDFMVMCNRAVGTYFYKNKIPAIFRTHDEPVEERLQELSVFSSKFGYNFKPNGDTKKIAKEINNLLLEIKGSSEENIITTLATRCMSKAKCSPESVFGHFGLGEQLQSPNNAYAWITSPIRRFADLKNHEILEKVLPNSGYNI